MPHENSMTRPILILSDFDGTICTMDMGNEVLNQFTRQEWRRIDADYCAGKIGSREAYGRMSAIFRGTREEMLGYIHRHERMDPHFFEFWRFCTHRGIDLKITSDGLDFYIIEILKKYGLKAIEFFANKVSFSEEGLSITFPLASEDCGRCGTCKRHILEGYRSSYERIFYVGDGHSDVCAARKADLVFAKNVLYEKCQEGGIACIPYETFLDVQNHLESILSHRNDNLAGLIKS